MSSDNDYPIMPLNTSTEVLLHITLVVSRLQLLSKSTVTEVIYPGPDKKDI